MSLVIKPAPSTRTPRRSTDKAGDPAMVKTFGRRGPRIGVRTTPIAEVLLAIVLINHALRHRVQYDSVPIEMPAIAAKAS